MSDSSFNISLIFLFIIAMLFNVFVVYKIAYSVPLVKTRIVVITNKQKLPATTCSFCSLEVIDVDDWKEIKSEPVQIM